jgi:hypothetical protein
MTTPRTPRSLSQSLAQRTARSFALGSLHRSLSRTTLLLRKQLWIWPLIAIVLLSVVAFWLRSAIEVTMQANLASELQSRLELQVAMLENWYRTQATNAEHVAQDIRVRTQIGRLLKVQEDSQPGLAAPLAEMEEARQELRRILGPFLTVYDYDGYLVADRSQTILAASNAEIVGRQGIDVYQEAFLSVFNGNSFISPPFLSIATIKDERGRQRSQVPTMLACAPVRDENFQVVGALALRLAPDREFTRILSLGRVGATGETYAFNQEGVMVSDSRFDQDLILLGLLPDEDDARSLLHLHLRDPGQDMTRYGRPKIRRSQLPLTKPAAAAIGGQSGVDVAGYRGYRGVRKVGAWTWLPSHRIGVITEIDYAEAYQPLTILRTAFWFLFALLLLSAIAIFIFTVVVARLQREAQKAAIEAKELGQYKLERKLGAGAMGVVYQGYHAMLRRPTAIKLLNVDKVTDESIKRFEQEVQLTCQLNHPNTIAIYDYGRTPEGVFYYAMEYLDGIDLQLLVDRYGPLPEGRVIHILRQVCGSLYEAHSKGLVHRDIKPANLMLNRRGGEADVVKVLDFGLVRAVDQDKQSGLTAADALTGTPLYMSPEAIQSPALVDACSDLYAVGAVGYFLLTGQPVFQAGTIVELLQQHLTTPATPPSQRLSRTVSEQLEHAILACLEKSRANRPQTARQLAKMLDAAPTAHAWTQDEAEAWWLRHERGQTPTAGSSSAADNRTIIGSSDE